MRRTHTKVKNFGLLSTSSFDDGLRLLRAKESSYRSVLRQPVMPETSSRCSWLYHLL